MDGRDKTVEDLLADYSEEATRRVRRIIRGKYFVSRLPTYKIAFSKGKNIYIYILHF